MIFVEHGVLSDTKLLCEAVQKGCVEGMIMMLAHAPMLLHTDMEETKGELSKNSCQHVNLNLDESYHLIHLIYI